MFTNFYKKKKKNYCIKNVNKKIFFDKKINKKIIKQENNIIKFCVFAGRKSNLEILHKYIEILLHENIIHEYHIFDFTRNINDKKYLFESFTTLNKIFNNQIFIHNNTNIVQTQNNQYDWSPFYKVISNKKFYKNSIIIKCDDDILFIDIHGLKNAIQERKKDKKSFLFHSNCINNNICAFYQRFFFNKITQILNSYPQGGILGPLFENPKFAYIMQYQFITDCINNINNIHKYYIKDTYINTRISINFIILNGEDCRYFKNTSYDDEYEVSSYYPEKLMRPNKIIGNFITCHYSYSLQEKILSQIKNIKILYNNLSKLYLSTFNKIDFIYSNLSLNNYKTNNISNNKFNISDCTYNKYSISDIDNNYLYIPYESNSILLNNKKRSYFNITFLDDYKITISIGIYKFNRFNLSNEFKNRNLLIKLMYDKTENIIQLIYHDNLCYLQFVKSKLYINKKNNTIILSNEPITSWIFNKNNNNDKIYVKRFSKNKKFYYKNLSTGNIYTNFYLGWGCENIIDIYNLD